MSTRVPQCPPAPRDVPAMPLLSKRTLLGFAPPIEHQPCNELGPGAEAPRPTRDVPEIIHHGDLPRAWRFAPLRGRQPVTTFVVGSHVRRHPARTATWLFAACLTPTALRFVSPNASFPTAVPGNRSMSRPETLIVGYKARLHATPSKLWRYLSPDVLMRNAHLRAKIEGDRRRRAFKQLVRGIRPSPTLHRSGSRRGRSTQIRASLCPRESSSLASAANGWLRTRLGGGCRK